MIDNFRERIVAFREGMSAINKYHKAEGIALIVVGVIIGYLVA